jgi:hypothetical protein
VIEVIRTSQQPTGNGRTGFAWWMPISLDSMCVDAHPGDVAQLVEHLLCKQGVGGSSPLVSTTDGGPFRRSPMIWSYYASIDLAATVGG